MVVWVVVPAAAAGVVAFRGVVGPPGGVVLPVRLLPRDVVVGSGSGGVAAGVVVDVVFGAAVVAVFVVAVAVVTVVVACATRHTGGVVPTATRPTLQTQLHRSLSSSVSEPCGPQ